MSVVSDYARDAEESTPLWVYAVLLAIVGGALTLGPDANG